MFIRTAPLTIDNAIAYAAAYLADCGDEYRTGNAVMENVSGAPFVEVGIWRDGEQVGSMDVWEVEPGKLYGEW